MRQYYLCDPSGQNITGPHTYQDLMRLSGERALTKEWFVAEAGSQSFTPFAEAGILRGILFEGVTPPVDPPPVGSFKLKGPQLSPARAMDSAQAPAHLSDHREEFTKVVEKSIRLQRPKLPDKEPDRNKTHSNEPLSPENILVAAREDFKKALQKHDEAHFNPPPYWDSPAGAKMKQLIWFEVANLGVWSLIILAANHFGMLNRASIVALPSCWFICALGIGMIIYFIMS